MRNEGGNTKGNEVENVDIYVNSIPSHTSNYENWIMRVPTRLIINGINLYKVEIRTNKHSLPIGENAKEFFIFLGASIKGSYPYNL